MNWIEIEGYVVNRDLIGYYSFEETYISNTDGLINLRIFFNTRELRICLEEKDKQSVDKLLKEG